MPRCATVVGAVVHVIEYPEGRVVVVVLVVVMALILISFSLTVLYSLG